MDFMEQFFSMLRREVQEVDRMDKSDYKMGCEDALRNVAIGLAHVFNISRENAYQKAGL